MDDTLVTPQTTCDTKRGFGFLDAASASAGKPTVFAVDVEEGNYDVTIRFGRRDVHHHQGRVAPVDG